MTSDYILNDSNVLSLFYDFLPPKDWMNLSSVSKNANVAFKMFLNIKFGDINTWAYDCPIHIHKWKCRYYPNGPFDQIKPTKPIYFSNSQNTVLSTFCRPKIKII